MLELGIDFGSYTPDDAGDPHDTRRRLECCRDRFGVEWASVGVQGNVYLHRQIAEAIPALGGEHVDTYIIPYTWFEDPAPRTHRALDQLDRWRGLISPWVWFDVETLYGQPNPTKAQATNYTREALRIIKDRGWKAGIYTSRSMWSALIGTSEFGEYPLWEAWYGQQYRPWVPFAGWTKRTGLQWQGSTQLCGLNVDLNTWETREQSMTDEQVKALIGEVLDQTGRLGKKVDELARGVDYLFLRNDVDQAPAPPLTLKQLYYLSGVKYPYEAA